MNNASKGGFPILGILGLIFITLKLIGEISWSWFWVLSPFWIPFAIVIGAVLFVVGKILIRSLIKNIKRKFTKKRD